MMNILFLSNPIKRDGAPLRMFEIIEYLKKNISNVQIDVLADSMEISNIYGNYVDEIMLLRKKQNNIRLWDKIKEKAKYYIFVKNRDDSILQKKLGNKEYDIIYANSITMLQRAKEVKQFFPNAKVILHLRELGINSVLYNPNYKSDIQIVDRVICISKCVFAFAYEKCEVPKEKLLLAYSGTHLENVYKHSSKKEKFIVGGVGGYIWRKGIEFFLLVAKEVCWHNDEICFEWVGISERDRIILEEDLVKLNLENRIKFHPSSDHVIDIMNNWSVFLSLAKEEPLGVASIEAGALGLPILAFRGSGGPEEILSDGGGLLSEYLDVRNIAENILKLASDSMLYKECSDKISQSVRKYDIKNTLPQIAKLISEI